ncbi:MAG TPA: TolC family protein [Burkholderiales bacterium]|nr:TolC family protein [Burkholderiales bacterium]
MVFALPGRVVRPLVCSCFFGLAVAAPFAHAAGTDPLPLVEALKIGEKVSPRLAAQGAALAAATELVPRASELPDPKLRVGVDNLPVNGADRYRYDSDFMTMRKIGVMQDFPNGEKRRLRGERAALERDVEAANLDAQRAALRREIALAWLELYFAQQARAPLVELVGEMQLQLDTVSAAIAAGRQNTADALALRGAGVAAQDRVIEQDRTIERARYALAAWIRDEASRPLANPPDTSAFDHPPTALLANLHEHPEQRIYAEREALARTDAALAANSKKSDWSLELAYGQRGPAFSNMISVMVSIDLPWEAEKRQDRDLAAKRLLAEQAQAQTEEARRMHEAELRGVYADWQTAGVRSERFEKLLLPLARERVAAALAAYRGGRGDLGVVLEARRAETETRLGFVQSQLERARAWARLNFLLPHEAQP